MLVTNRFSVWLLAQSRLMRYAVIALFVHAALVLFLGSIKLISAVRNDALNFPLLTGLMTGGSDSGPNRDDAGGGGGTGGDGGGLAKLDLPPSTVPVRPIEAPRPNIPTVVGVSADLANIDVRGVGDSVISGPTMLAFDPNITAVSTNSPYRNRFNKGVGTGSGTGSGHGTGSGPGSGLGTGSGRATEETERAVLAGLRWLKAHQEADGSWKCFKSDAAGSALAMLAFLGHGETPESQEFGVTVNSGLHYLIRTVGDDGLVTQRDMYAQGLVTLALAEGYGLTQSAAIREKLERAVATITRSQRVHKDNPRHTGGWRYTPTSGDADTSVSGWMIMALKSANTAGITVPKENFELASKFLWQMYGDHGFGYNAPTKTPNMTGVGVLCLQFLGHGDDPRLKHALDYLHQQKVAWENSDDSFVLYGWYYITQAMFQAGGQHWDYWNRQVRDTLLKNQMEDGRWQPPPKSKNETRNLASSPVYATALATMMLEVYYRYVPLYRSPAAPQTTLNR